MAGLVKLQSADRKTVRFVTPRRFREEQYQLIIEEGWCILSLDYRVTDRRNVREAGITVADLANAIGNTLARAEAKPAPGHRAANISARIANSRKGGARYV